MRSRAVFANPIVRQQWIRFARLGPAYRIGMLVAWFSLSWLIRMKLLEFAFGMPGALAMTALSILSFTFRPDIFVAMLLFIRLIPPDEWRDLRQHLALSFLTVREVLIGKIVVPLTLLYIGNLLVAPFVYSNLPELAAMGGLTRRETIIAVVFVVGFALLEDLLFTSVCVMVALRETIAPRGVGFVSLIRAMMILFLIGFGTAMIGLIAEQIAYFSGIGWWAISRPLAAFLMPNVYFFALVFVFEAILIRYFWRDSHRKLRGWFHEE